MILKDLIIEKLKAAGKPIKKTGDNFIMTTCLNPNHNEKHPSFSINLESGKGKCFACGFSVGKDYWLDGNLDEETIEEISRLAIYNEVEQKLNSKSEKYIWDGILPIKSEKLSEGWRGLNKDTIEKLDLYITRRGKYKDRVIFPFYDGEGNLLGFNSRALTPDITPKYLYAPGIKPSEILYPFPEKTEYIVLVEGIMDAISLTQEGIPAIMNFGVNFTFSENKIKTLLSLGVETVYLMFDNDKAGQEAVKRYEENKYFCSVFDVKPGIALPALIPFYQSSCKDFNEFLTSSK